MIIKNKIFTIKFCRHRWVKYASHESRPNHDKYFCGKCDAGRLEDKK